MNLDSDISARGIYGRKDHENPLSPTCKLHLRRICGTCAHFDGELRQAACAMCTIFRAKRHLMKSAGKCDRWTRK
ncbi:hypothetical protein ACGYLV_11915 [Sulfitobacter sp. M21595]|uniref:hypothetical protein n=1 Tax=Sulfitobacter sp. M21595 TaxID=3368574 RepID=UPI003745F62A